MNYIAKVEQKIEDDNGKLKKSVAVFLIEDAVNVTDAEAIVTTEYLGVNFRWKIISISETKICQVLSAVDRADSVKA